MTKIYFAGRRSRGDVREPLSGFSSPSNRTCGRDARLLPLVAFRFPAAPGDDFSGELSLDICNR